MRKIQKWAQKWAVPVIAIGTLAAVGMSQPPATPKQGRELFEKRCTGCHALDNIKVGPPLRHVFARHSGGDSTFPYSDALKKADITWDASTLDRWISNPDAMVPDNDMSFRLNNADERAAIISYLKELSGK